MSNFMDYARNADAELASRLKALRATKGISLDTLAERSGVSRAMISVIERGTSSPTAKVLDRLAAGLGVTMAALFTREEPVAPAPLVRRADQPSWRDPETGYVRRNLSPPGFASPIELVEVTLPAGARVAYDTAARSVRVDQQVWVLDGSLELNVGDTTHALEAGDCLAFSLDQPTAFRNLGKAPARYLVALVAAASR